MEYSGNAYQILSTWNFKICVQYEYFTDIYLHLLQIKTAD